MFFKMKNVITVVTIIILLYCVVILNSVTKMKINLLNFTLLSTKLNVAEKERSLIYSLLIWQFCFSLLRNLISFYELQLEESRRMQRLQQLLFISRFYILVFEREKNLNTFE